LILLLSFLLETKELALKGKTDLQKYNSTFTSTNDNEKVVGLTEIRIVILLTRNAVYYITKNENERMKMKLMLRKK
jgi:hypothetical protein